MGNLKIQSLCSFSNKGDRMDQEDSYFVNELKRIFAVSDGFGGPVSGLAASKDACDATLTFLSKEAGDEDATLPFVIKKYYSLPGNVLFNAVIHANQKLLQFNEKRTIHERGGASLLAGFMQGEVLALAGVGACSAWLHRGGLAIELVKPRTYSRLIEPFEPDSLEGKDTPLMALGIADDLDPEITETKLQKGDTLLLQTDGVHKEIRTQVFEEIQHGASPKEVLRSLEGAHFSDNATAIIMSF